MNSTGCKLLLTVCLMLVIPALVIAQNGKIKGFVKDASTKEPVVGANVIIDGTTFGAAADAEGTYYILNVPPGTYRVTASAVGYAKKTVVNVEVHADQILTIDFDLQSQAIGLGEVVVEAQRRTIDPSQTTAKTRITSNDIASLPIRQVSDLLSISASVFKGFVRGGKQYETKTLVDGVDVSDQYYTAAADQSLTPYTTYNGVTHQRTASKSSLLDLNADAVQEANVQTGGVGADYSSATAGVISYSLKEGRGKRIRVDGEEIVLFKIDEQVCAIRNLCPHQRFQLLHEGEFKDSIVTCPMHGWAYDVRTGISVNASGKVKTFPVEVRDGKVFVNVDSLNF